MSASCRSAVRRGGGRRACRRSTAASSTGRVPTSALPAIETLPSADVLLRHLDGRPIRGARTLPDGSLPVRALADVAPGTKIVLTATNGERVDARVVVTERLGR